MIKREELTNPASCMSRAKDDEMTFVLLGRDRAAPHTIRMWIAERIRLGKNQPGDAQLVEAADCAWVMDNERRIQLAEKHSRQPLEGDELVEFDRLQKECFDYLDAKHPRNPKLDSLAKTLDGIEARLRQRS